jgi:nucleoside-diphosphate-sugar epimerase
VAIPTPARRATSSRAISMPRSAKTSTAATRIATAGCDYVLHVASPLGATDATDDALVVPARDGTLRVLRAATGAGVRRVVMTSAANAASPSSYAEEGITDETLWTDRARRVLGWQPRPAAQTVLDCAHSLIAHGIV